MKIYEEKYPMGTIRKQKTAGIYTDRNLYDNLKELAKAIVHDNSFLILVSSQALSVRTGKTTFTQYMAETWNYIMLKEHGVKLDFNMNNIAFNADDFEKKAFKLHEDGEKYGVIICDESDDLTGHSLSAEVKKIKRFLRKSGQLNLLMIMILPDFFEFPKSIAINRSVALITVDYGEHFSRGRWKFYDFKSKKKLYIKGKSFNDYSVQQPSFYGMFAGTQYLVDEKQYKDEKFKDFKEDSDKERAKRVDSITREYRKKIFFKMLRKFKGEITQRDLCETLDITERTAINWKKKKIEN